MSGGERGGKSGRGRGERVEKGLRRHRNAQRRFVTSVASGASRASGKGEDRSRMGEKGCCGIFFSFSPRFFYLFYFFPLLSSRRSSLFSSLLFLSSFLSSFLFFFPPFFIYFASIRRRNVVDAAHFVNRGTRLVLWQASDVVPGKKDTRSVSRHRRGNHRGANYPPSTPSPPFPSLPVDRNDPVRFAFSSTICNKFARRREERKISNERIDWS